MAIYYIDPHTTVNGNGSYASPWSFTTNVRSGLTSGDEVRVLSKYLTDILTPTSYTGSYSSFNAITSISGGGGVADFPGTTIVYFPDFDIFGVVTANNGVSITFGNNPILPDFSQALVINMRIVDKTVASAGCTSSSMYLDANNIPNVNFSDGWVDATTQVTDGTAKTLLWSTTTSSGCYFYPTATGGYVANSTISLTNTHVLGCISNASAGVFVNTSATNLTLSINQIHAQSSTGGAITVGTSTFFPNGVVINITNHRSYQIYMYLYGSATVNVNNLICRIVADSGISSNPYSNGVVNINNLYGYQRQNVGVFGCTAQQSYLSISILNRLHYWIAYTNYTAVFDGAVYSPRSITLAEGLDFKDNYGSSTPSTSFSYAIQLTNQAYTTVNPRAVLANLSYPSSWTITTDTFYSQSSLNIPLGSARNYTQITTTYVFPYPPSNLQNLGGGASSFRNGQNLLYVFKDGSPPIEVLPVQNAFPSATGMFNFVPNITTDTVFFRTNSPSLKCTLTSWSSGNWSTNNLTPKSLKTIKIPCQGGTSYTVSGYIYTSITSYATGDIGVRIILNDESVTSADITTASAGAWEQFSLAFTASMTAEYELVISAYFANSGAFWLDDLTIS